MDKVFWLLPGRLAGRPGPDREPWDLDSLREGGIQAILSVNDGLSCHAADFVASGIAYARVSLSPNAPPQPGDDEVCLRALPRAYAFVQAQIAEGRGVLVHCSSGKDRTGLFLCYFLMRQVDLSPVEAIEAVRRVRPIALSAVGWEEFAVQVLASADSRR
jgi:Dual specificity phosphatase, catalytic domain